MKPFAWDPEALAEVEAAAAYLEGKHEGLGQDFRHEMEAALQDIQRRPALFTAYQLEGMRRCILQRFKYTIFFAELDDYVWIAAVAHHSQKPGYWHGRTP